MSDDDGSLTLHRGDERTALIAATGLRQRGAVIADIDPSRPGQELATAGYDRMIRVFLATEGGFEAVVPYKDTERFHHLAAGQLDSDAGAEIVGVSFAGTIVLVEAVAPGR